MNTLALPIKAKGAPSLHLELTVEREIEVSDLPQANDRTFVPKPLEKLRAHHHHLATMIASGMTQREAAAALGRSEHRVATLMRIPSFANLVEEKRKEIDDTILAARADPVQLMSDVQIVALDELKERLEDEPEKFSNSQLLSIVGETSDRVGPMKRQGNVSVNFDFADRLAAARRAMTGGPSLERTRDNR